MKEKTVKDKKSTIIEKSVVNPFRYIWTYKGELDAQEEMFFNKGFDQEAYSRLIINEFNKFVTEVGFTYKSQINSILVSL